MQNKVMKRCLAAIVAAILVGGVTVTALPLTALAENFETDYGEIQNGEHYDVNNASYVTNNGTVVYNDAHIQMNIGTVVYNDPSGNISYNEGTVNNNRGSINTNNSIIETNRAEGTVVTNNASVNRNDMAGSVNNSPVGVVTDNYGTVTGGGTVENNYTLYHANRKHGTVSDGVTVTNQYFEVKVPNVENGTAALSDFIHNTQFLPGSDLTFLKSTGTGTITFTANDDYEIVGDTVDNCQGTGFVYSVAQSNGVFTVTLSSVTDAITITPQALNLVIQAIQQQNPDVPDNVIIRVAPSVQISEDDTRSNRAATETAPATGNVITAAQISEMIESALAANPTETVLDVDLGNDPSLTADSLIALCEKNNVAKRCHFTHNGMKFVLFVPVVDPTSATYQQCKALLDSEPGKQAGPIRLSQLFAQVGFSLSGE